MTLHRPILAEKIVELLTENFLSLKPPSSEQPVFLDCTLGGGGHTALLLEKLAAHPKNSPAVVVAMDRDLEAIERGRKRLAAEIEQGKLKLVHAPFSEFAQYLEGYSLYGVLADLGFSSDQIEAEERGFSFLGDGPLDMRMDPSRGETAAQLLRRVSERELTQILSEFGEERYSARIAKKIVNTRNSNSAPRTTKELVALVVDAFPPKERKGRIHVATRTFQALRIAVNHELEELDALLSHVILLLKRGGRAAFLSFHSLEDRRVKLKLRELAPHKKSERGEYRELTRKPILPGDDEMTQNPRARSAKLRVIERIL